MVLSDNLYVIRTDGHFHPEIYKGIIFKTKGSADRAKTNLIKKSKWHQSVSNEVMTLEQYIDELKSIIDNCPYQE